MINYWLKREDDRRDFSPSDEIEEVEEVIEDTTENDMNDVEPAPVENAWWKIYREAKKVILDEPVEFALNQLNQSIQKVPKLGYISALAIGFAAILLIINEFVPNVEDLVYGAGLLLILGIFAKIAFSFRPDATQEKTISWSMTLLIVLFAIIAVVSFAFKLFNS